MKKTTGVITILAGVVAGIIVGYLIIGNPAVFINNQKLKSAVKSVRTETASLNEVVPFAWDIVYTFAPYTAKENIEKNYRL